MNALEDGAERILASVLGPMEEALVLGSPTLAQQLGAKARWVRRKEPEATPSAEPPEGPYEQIVARMPRGAELARMLLHLLAARLAEGGQLHVAAPNDEGGRSLSRKLAEVFGEVSEREGRYHARLVTGSGVRTARGRLEDWREEVTLLGERYATWPGLFAHGRLDEGTEMLLSALPDPSGARALDLGCGIGVIGANLARRGAAALDLVDIDALAAHASAINVPSASVSCADTLPPGDSRYDLVASNPPIHVGADSDWSVIERMAAALPARLSQSGELWIVAQGTVPVPRLFRSAFRSIEVRKKSRSFLVWRLTGPGLG